MRCLRSASARTLRPCSTSSSATTRSDLGSPHFASIRSGPCLRPTPRGLLWCAPHGGHHPRHRGGTRPLAGRVCPHPRAARPRPEPGRAGHLLGDVERALLLQVQPPFPPPPAD